MHIIDFHTHIGKDKDGTTQSIADLERSMKECGVNGAVVFPFNSEDLVGDSLELLRISKKKKHLYPFLRFDPKKMTPEKLGELLKKGFYGVKLHPRSQKFDPLNRKFFPLYKEIEKQRLPLLFHTRLERLRQTDPLRIVKLAKYFPKLKIVLGHFASSDAKTVKVAKQHNNVFLETSVSSSPWIIERIGKTMGFDRLLFGSDSPLSDQSIELAKIRKLPIRIRKKIFQNALKILKLKRSQ